jgi:VWFA-related protein
MRVIRTVCLLGVAGLGSFAQAPPPTPTEVPEIADAIIRSSVTQVVAPTLVTDRQGNMVDGIQPAQFHLYDNGKEQNIQVDVAFQPISVVVAIEASSRVESILTQVRHLGTLMPLIVGDHGDAAVVEFDSRIRMLQDFTNDPDKIKVAIDHVTAGNSSSRMYDTVDRAVYMLRRHAPNNRKIILLVSETRDFASEGKLRETLIDAQLSNVLIYAVNISQLAVRLTEKPTEPRPDPIAITARPTTMGQPSTPTSAAQNYGVQNQVQFAPLLKEIYTDAKRLFVENATEMLTKATGGTEVMFLKQRGLEDAVQRIGTEIRSQYLISYNPTNKDEPGFHEINVTVERSTYITKTRPGYWLSGGKGQ